MGNKNGKLWTTDEEVSPEVLAKVRGSVQYVCNKDGELTAYVFMLLLLPQVQAIKLLVRWLLGMKNNQSKSANSTLRLLSAMLVSEGDLTEQKKIR